MNISFVIDVFSIPKEDVECKIILEIESLIKEEGKEGKWVDETA
jgi:hypothetical protein